MNKKITLSDLNEKTWYRTLKVIYFISFISVIILIFSINWGYIKELDYDRTMLSCNFGNNATLPLSSVYSYNYSSDSPTVSDFKNGIFVKERFLDINNSSFRNAVINKCSMAIQMTRAEYQAKYGIQPPASGTLVQPTQDKSINLNGAGLTLDQLISMGAKPVNNQDLFRKIEITPVYSYQGLIDVLKGLLITLVVFELIRRIFYYIKLGTFIPKE